MLKLSQALHPSIPTSLTAKSGYYPAGSKDVSYQQLNKMALIDLLYPSIFRRVLLRLPVYKEFTTSSFSARGDWARYVPRSSRISYQLSQ